MATRLYSIPEAARQNYTQRATELGAMLEFLELGYQMQFTEALSRNTRNIMLAAFQSGAQGEIYDFNTFKSLHAFKAELNRMLRANRQHAAFQGDEGKERIALVDRFNAAVELITPAEVANEIAARTP